MMPLTFAKQGERNSIIKVGGKEETRRELVCANLMKVRNG